MLTFLYVWTFCLAAGDLTCYQRSRLFQELPVCFVLGMHTIGHRGSLSAASEDKVDQSAPTSRS